MAAVRSTDGTRPTRFAADVAVAAVVGLGCLGLYVSTLAPGLAFPGMDVHELTLNAIRLGVAHPSGYPIYTWAGFLFTRLMPIGDMAYRMNLLSAVGGAVGVGLLVLVGRRLGLGIVAAVFAALLFGFATDFWSQAVITEVYAPDVAMVGATMLCLLVWADRVTAGRDGATAFVAFAAVFGLSLGTHLSNLLFAPGYSLFVLATDPGILRRPREIALALAAFLAGAAQYLWLPFRGARFDQFPNPAPTTLAGMWAYTFGAFAPQRFAFPAGMFPIRIGEYLLALRDNLGVVGIALGMVGSWRLALRHPPRLLLLLGTYLANVIVFSQFSVQDIRVFFIAGYAPWALLAGVGVQALVDEAARRVPPPVVHAAAAIALAAWLAPIAVASHAANDETGDTTVADFGRNAYDVLPPHANLIVPRGAYGADMVYWQTAEKLRRDVAIIGQPPVSPPLDRAAPIFTTVRVADAKPIPYSARWLSAADLPEGWWYTPVLFGASRAMTLSRVEPTPPSIVVREAPPGAGRPVTVGPVELLAAVVERGSPARRFRVDAYWRLPSVDRFVLATRVADRMIETHEAGLGTLLRYAQEHPVDARPIVHETFEVVLPSTLPRGEQPVSLGVVESGDGGFRTHWREVGRVVAD